MTGSRDVHTRKWHEFRAKVFSVYGRICWLCGHDGANQVDHVIPRRMAPELAWTLSNLRPSHGTNNRCPQCGKCCNQSRTRRDTIQIAGPQLASPRTQLTYCDIDYRRCPGHKGTARCW